MAGFAFSTCQLLKSEEYLHKTDQSSAQKKPPISKNSTFIITYSTVLSIFVLRYKHYYIYFTHIKYAIALYKITKYS